MESAECEFRLVEVVAYDGEDPAPSEVGGNNTDLAGFGTNKQTAEADNANKEEDSVGVVGG